MKPCGLRFLRLCLVALAAAANAALAFESITIDHHETAGISGSDWNRTLPGATTVDAVHRTVLVRFPGAARALRARLEAGSAIAKAELVMDYDGYEIVPERYLVRVALGESKWKSDRPEWHVVAWALRRPWLADKEHGPTFNAYISGAGYWTQYGAADTASDRYPQSFGPAPLSYSAPVARLDITRLFVDPAFGGALGARLRSFEENGLLLKKWETYDSRYRQEGDAYEWAVPTGGHGLKFKNPRLVLTLRSGERSSSVQLPPATDIASLAQRLKLDGTGGIPTAKLTPAAELKELARQLSLRQARVPAWQAQRLAELYRIGGDRVSPWQKAAAGGDYKKYEALVQEFLAMPPRYWRGWDIQDDLLVWHLYRPLLPAYVQDHLKVYWASWLMPDVPTADLVAPQSKEAVAYWQQSRDWRGRASFFRGAYNFTTSTQNFNHTAAMGALLGGDLIGSRYAVADGRHGLEHFPLRLWAMLDGSTQEMLDHYYFSITLSAQKMFADFGPAPLDRLMGSIMLDRSIELLASGYHPYLRRIVAASGRARLPGILVEQDGIYGVLHTLSRKGTLNYLDLPFEARTHGLPVWGYDFPPGRVAVQAYRDQWAPEWVANLIDEKRFPFEETSTETTRGAFNPPLWRRTYLGRHYGLASQDIRGGTADVLAQWNPGTEPVSRMEDLGTLTLRYAVNEPDMATTNGGIMPYAGGMVTFQHRNRAIVCTKPRTEKERTIALAGNARLKSLASVIALWNFRPQPGWEIHVGGRRVTELPAKVKAGQAITIRDGAAYVGIIPIPATDLGRTDEVVIASGGGGGKTEPHGAYVKPALTITSYNYQQNTPIAFDALNWPHITTGAYGGFVIELGDAEEYGDFSTFAKRMQSNRLTTRWDGRTKLLHLEYRSGKDVMEMGCSTDYAQSDVHYAIVPGQQSRAVPYRRINGAWPYLLPGIDRDTSTAQQGTTGRLEKNGAVLVTEKGRKAYLQTEPIAGVYVGYNPLPDPTSWTLSVPGGIEVRADGKVGLMRVAIQPSRNELTVDSAAKGNQKGPEMAANLLVEGLPRPPSLVRNGKIVKATLQIVNKEGKNFYVVPLADD